MFAFRKFLITARIVPASAFASDLRLKARRETAECLSRDGRCGSFAAFWPGRAPSSLSRWSQPVDATLYLKGKRWSVVMDRGFRRGFARPAAPGLRGERKCDPEDRAALRLVLCDDLTIVSVDDRSRNRQAHAHAICFR